MDAFYFVNNVVVYKALLIKENGGKVVYGYRPGSPWGRPYGLSYSWGGGSPSGAKSPEVGRVQNCEDTMILL